MRVPQNASAERQALQAESRRAFQSAFEPSIWISQHSHPRHCIPGWNEQDAPGVDSLAFSQDPIQAAGCAAGRRRA